MRECSAADHDRACLRRSDGRDDCSGDTLSLGLDQEAFEDAAAALLRACRRQPA